MIGTDINCFSREASIVFKIPSAHMSRINWESAKRLMPGSLVLLSPDNFQRTIFWGIIKQRDGK
jgi:hypothetical protein